MSACRHICFIDTLCVQDNHLALRGGNGIVILKLQFLTTSSFHIGNCENGQFVYSDMTFTIQSDVYDIYHAVSTAVLQS